MRHLANVCRVGCALTVYRSFTTSHIGIYRIHCRLSINRSSDDLRSSDLISSGDVDRDLSVRGVRFFLPPEG